MTPLPLSTPLHSTPYSFPHFPSWSLASRFFPFCPCILPHRFCIYAWNPWWTSKSQNLRQKNGWREKENRGGQPFFYPGVGDLGNFSIFYTSTDFVQCTCTDGCTALKTTLVTVLTFLLIERFPPSQLFCREIIRQSKSISGTRTVLDEKPLKTSLPINCPSELHKQAAKFAPSK